MPMQLALAMLAILATWAVAAMALVGIGRLAHAAVLHGTEPTLDECFWTGFALLLLLLLGWHFVARIDERATLAAAALGVIGLVVGRKDLRKHLAGALATSRGPLAISVLSVVWLANRALSAPGSRDSAVYHIPAIEWFTAHPVVHGLGNLQGPLAFNNSSLLYAALLDVGPWRHRSEHVANGLLLAALMTQGIFAAARLLRNRAWTAADAFLAVQLIPCLYMATDPTIFNVASPTTDVVAIIVTLVSTAWLLSLTSSGRAEGSVSRALSAALLMAAAVTIKLSTIAFSAVGWLLLGLWWKRHRDTEHTGRARRAAVAAGSVAVMMAALWMTRGVVLSGYPAFPMRVGAVNVDWRVPDDRAEYHDELITLLGRHYVEPGPTDNSDPRMEATSFSCGFDEYRSKRLEDPWLTSWLKKLPGYKAEITLPAALCVLGIAIVVAARTRKRGTGPIERSGVWWLAAAPGAALAFWFIKAPQPRLALHLTWSLAGLCLAMAAIEVRAHRRERRAGIGLFGLICFLSVGMLASRAVHNARPDRGGVLSTFWILPGPDGALHLAPRATLVERTTHWGLPVNSVNGRIWHAPLVTTCEFDQRLRLRRPDDIGAGFRSDEVEQAVGH
jgi:hypothetical protein